MQRLPTIPKFSAAVVSGILTVLCLSGSDLVLPSILVPCLVAGVVTLILEDWRHATAASAVVWLLAGLFFLAPPADPSLGHRGDFNLLLIARAHFLHNWGPPPALALSWISLAASLTLFGWLRGYAGRTIPVVLLLILGSACLLSPAQFSQPLLDNFASNPPPGFRFDGRLWMKLFYLTQEGTPFYQAFLEAFAQDGRPLFPDTLGEWRTPVLFGLWRFLVPADGWALIYSFLVMAVVAMVAAYFLAQRAGAGAHAVLAPILLFPYFLYGVYGFYFAFVEYWVAVLILVSLTLYLSDRQELGLTVALLAFVSRELILLYFLCISADYLWRHRRERRKLAFLAGIWAVAGGFYIAHRAIVIEMVGHHGVDLERVLTPGWLGSLWGALSFGFLLLFMRETVILVCALLGAAGAVVAARGRFLLVATIALTTLFLMVFSHGGQEYQGRTIYLPDYWGTLLSPVLLSLVPVGLNSLSERGARDKGQSDTE